MTQEKVVNLQFTSQSTIEVNEDEKDMKDDQVNLNSYITSESINPTNSCFDDESTLTSSKIQNKQIDLPSLNETTTATRTIGNRNNNNNNNNLNNLNSSITKFDFNNENQSTIKSDIQKINNNNNQNHNSITNKSNMINEIRKHKVRFLKSCGLYSCFITIGLSLGIVGPTLIDLMYQVKSDLTTTSLVLPCRAGGYAIGSFVSGLYYNRMNQLLLTIFTMLFSGAVTLAIPFMSDVNVVLALFLLLGLSLGLFEAGKCCEEK